MGLERQAIALQKIQAERQRQDHIHGIQSDKPDHMWSTILTVLNGNVAATVSEQNTEDLIVELTQLAAVCVCWLEAIDERGY